jgi:hypothetical protein
MTVARWFDSWAGLEAMQKENPCVDWLRCVPLSPCTRCVLGVIRVGAPAVAMAAALYVIRMFISRLYHCYFSHRTFGTSRPTILLARLAPPYSVAPLVAASPPSSSVLGSTGGSPLSDPTRILMEPHGLVHVSIKLSHQPPGCG